VQVLDAPVDPVSLPAQAGDISVQQDELVLSSRRQCKTARCGRCSPGGEQAADAADGLHGRFAVFA